MREVAQNEEPRSRLFIAKTVFQLHWVALDTGEIVSRHLKRAAFLEHFFNRSPRLAGIKGIAVKTEEFYRDRTALASN